MDISTEIAAIEAASEGSELRQPIVDALNKLNTDVLPTVTAADAGKILKVGADGWEVGEKSGYMPVPSQTMQITANDTYDVTDYSEAVVNVPNAFSAEDEGKVVSNGALVSQTSQTVTANGTYDTTLNDEVVVNVSGGGGTLGTKTITANGTYNASGDGLDGYSSVTVNVSGGGVSLPPEYQQVEYLEHSGGQYVTMAADFPVNALFSVICGITSDSPTTEMGVAGKKDIVEVYFYSNKLALWTGQNSNYYKNFYGTQSGIAVDTPYTLTFLYAGISTISPILVGVYRTDNYLFTGRIYEASVRTFDTTTDKYEYAWRLIPCYRIADSVPGWYDVVNDVFYTNEGSGSYTAGPDVA